jgi:hypothetical protein
LKGPKEQVGWRTGTSGQGVEVKLYPESFLSISSQQILMGIFFFFASFILMQRLQIMDSENLVQVDTLNRIKWQSSNFSTGLMLWGQRLNVATLLTSFSSNSDSFYSLEIHYNKIALYLNLSKWNYSYWEFKAFQKQEHHICQSGFNGITVIQLSVLVVM